MARFEQEQVADILSIQQLVHDWARELDINEGLGMAEHVTGDCQYHVHGGARNGRDAVVKFYEERKARLEATDAGLPVQRHALSNLRVQFASATEASITFTLIYFTTAGQAAGQDHADPAAVADVWMDCRKEDDGHWRISMFDSTQSFRRPMG